MLDVPSMHQVIYSTLPEIARTKRNCRLCWDIPIWLLIVGISLLNFHSSLVGDDGSMGIIFITPASHISDVAFTAYNYIISISYLSASGGAGNGL